MILQEWRYFLVAVQLLTRIPVGGLSAFEPSWLDRSVKFFPIVGVLIGLISAIVLFGAFVLLPTPLPAIAAVLAGVLITGALHEDGLADTADGFGASADRAASLDIMKDSRIGVYGALALFFALAMKVTAIDSVSVRTAVGALIGAHAFGRLATVAAMAYLPYVGDATRSKVRPNVVTGGFTVPVAALFGLVPALLLPWDMAMAAIVIGALGALGVAVLSWFKVGGYTGDVLGAIEQVAEISFLLAVAAIAAGPGG